MIADKWLSRLFGITICVLAVLSTMTLCTLVLRELPVPDPLDRFVTFLVGGIVGRLTGQRSAEPGDAPIPTTIQNQVTQPVPTTEGVPPVPPGSPDALLPAT